MNRTIDTSRYKMKFTRRTSTLHLQVMWLVLVLTSLAKSQEFRVKNRDLSRTLDTVIGIDLRSGRPMKEAIVPRSRHTTRERIKISKTEEDKETSTTPRTRSPKDDEVRSEDFLTLEGEESNVLPVSYSNNLE